MSTSFARQTLLTALVNDINQVAVNKDLPFPQAAQYIIAQRLGYDLDDVEFVDGSGDRGIDFWYASSGGIYVYQVKTHELNESGHIDEIIPFDNSGVQDLVRAYTFMTSDERPDKEHRLSPLLDKLEALVRNHKSNEPTTPVQVNFSLIVLGEGLTDQALDELAAFEDTLQRGWSFRGIPVAFHVEYKTIDDLLKEAWREENFDWIDVNEQNRDYILLSPLRQAGQGERDYLNDNKSAIFYCKAIDLITAYKDFGYQIFEPNVRANVGNSSVNSAIQESASHEKSMKEFRFLNNGITILCNRYEKPAGQRPEFKITKPGVINGLQTVTSLSTAYDRLSNRLRASFDDNCYVLVRLLSERAINQISDVVLATNNQNSMKPRNLVSNTSEQIHFAAFFAQELDWFYEAKEGAWNAFRQNHRTWRPRINKHPRSFKAKKGYKKIDNHDLAQDWLAFLGFASEAVNNKKQLFNKERLFYRFIFLSRPTMHAYQNYSNVAEAQRESEHQSPDPHLMLVAHLSRIFVHKVVPSTQASRKDALSRKGVIHRESISTAKEEEILSEDRTYILNQVLKSMETVFVDYLGYLLFSNYGSNTHELGQVLLKNRSWNDLHRNLNWEEVVVRVANGAEEIHDDDLLLVLWLIFKEAVETVLNQAWSTSYHNARNRSLFILNHRHEIFEEVAKMDSTLKQRIPMRVYTGGFQEGEGIFGYLRRTIDVYR